MNYGEGGNMSPAEVALLDRRSGSGFGSDGDNAWWIILFLLFGFGRNGFGGGFGGGSGVGENYVLATDFATIERKLDSVNSGLCDGFYAMAQQFSNTNQNIFNGNAALQQTLCQGFNGVNQAIVTNGYETRLGVNNLASQLAACCCDIRTQIADCCCTTQRGLDGINYNMAINTNALQQTLCNNTRDIIENANANYRAIHEELVSNKLEAKNDRIAELQAQVSKLQLAASQEKQNNYLTATMDANVAEILRRTGNDCPVPAYVVNGPTPINFPTNCCGNFTGFNNGCGCGNY